ncbi:MAG: glycogen synthase GlgA [Verrucomicrobiota bacterium]|jgi:starch synthase
MKILLASSEAYPYSKSGGLADMLGALAKFLGRAGHQVGLVTPLYRCVRSRFPAIQPMDWRLDLPLGGQRIQAKVCVGLQADGETIYFIDYPPFYDRAELYGEHGADYPDNAERFIFFSKCVVNLARYLPWRPEVLHLHDWQPALAAAFVADQRRRGGWASPPPVCLTIHNMAFQGNFPAAKFALTNLPSEFFRVAGMEFYGGMNCLKAGITYADRITTVSPRYAREITTEQYGCGLDGVLRWRQNALVGILNGVDYDEWKTESNPHLLHSYSAGDLQGKTANKMELQKELGLPVRAEVPLFGTVGRLAQQKGVDIQLGALEEMLAADMQFILLGSGGREFERGYRLLAQRFAGKCAVKIGFDTTLSHRIESGCDFFLMPSLFEPCGLNQLYSLRYGTIPIVRLTGGLDDSVTDATDDPVRADGIKFTEYSVRALAKAIRKALVLYEDKSLLEYYRRNGMVKDFSWSRTAAAYEDVYRGLLQSRQQ